MGCASHNRRDGPNVCIGGEVISLNINYQLLLVGVCGVCVRVCARAHVYGPIFLCIIRKAERWAEIQDEMNV